MYLDRMELYGAGPHPLLVFVFLAAVFLTYFCPPLDTLILLCLDCFGCFTANTNWRCPGETRQEILEYPEDGQAH